FASPRLSRNPRSGRLHRHHLHRDTFAERLRQAVVSSGVLKRITSHTFRHCFATHHLWSGTNIREIQRLLGHADVTTTEIYTHVRNPNAQTPVSPLDRMLQSPRRARHAEPMVA
ncbi:MAG: tyrosine-type recombinase/integrase, partial [Planctomycetota bacterium]